MDWLIKKKIRDAKEESQEWMQKYDVLERKADALCEAAKEFQSYGRRCPPGCPCGYDKAEEKLLKAIAEYEGKK